MSIASTIAKNGKSASWRKMLGNAGTYDPATGVVDYSTTESVAIKVVLDGFGSVESTLRGISFDTKGLVNGGHVRAFTTSKLMPGDIVLIDEDEYTVVYTKTIWKKEKVVLYEALVKL